MPELQHHFIWLPTAQTADLSVCSLSVLMIQKYTYTVVCSVCGLQVLEHPYHKTYFQPSNLLSAAWESKHRLHTFTSMFTWGVCMGCEHGVCMGCAWVGGSGKDIHY